MGFALRLILLTLTIVALAAPAAASYGGAGNGDNTFVYDLANQPVTVGGAIPQTHVYDGNFKRVKTVENGKTVYQVFSRVTGSLVYRDEVTDGGTTDYVNVGGAALRLKKAGATSTPEYVHFDHQGSALAATNASGAILWRERYSPWGTRLLKPAGNRGDTGYTGHLMDNTTELVYMQARYYDSQIGRFYSTDPIGYQDQLNLYAYVANDPVNKIDPTGEFANILIGGFGGALVGAAIEAGVQLARDGKISDRGAIGRSALVGAAAGALGPAGGSLIRAATVGKAAASASKVSAAIPSGKALVAATDTAADVAGQPVLGAVDAALKGDDPGVGAVGGVGAAGAGTAVDAATVGNGSTPRSAGARGAAVALIKTVTTSLVKSAATSGASESVKTVPRDEED